jgi:heme exporter protein D
MDLAMDLGPHAAFIVVAYLVATAIMAALVAWVVGDYRRQLRILHELEAGGVTRRSERQAD